MGKPEEVLAFYEQVNESHPSEALRLASCRFLLRIEMIDEATVELENILALNEGSYYGTHLLSIAYHKRERHAESVELALKLLGTPLISTDIPYVCSQCNYTGETFVSFCPSCHAIDTLRRDYSKKIR